VGAGIEMRNSYILKSKVPSLSDRFRPITHSIKITGKEGMICSPSQPAAMRDEIERKYCFGLKSKMPFFQTDYHQT
jgi:hypothetical protein